MTKVNIYGIDLYGQCFVLFCFDSNETTRMIVKAAKW